MKESSIHSISNNQGKALHSIMNFLGFLIALSGFFLLGFWVIGPHMNTATTRPTPPHSDLNKDANWTKAPKPPSVARPEPKPVAKPAAQVEVSEVSHSPSTPANSSNIREADTLDQLAHSSDVPSPSPSPEATTPPATVQKPHRFSVQAGVYADRNNAEAVISDLSNQGYGARVRQVSRNGRTIYQVIVGNPKSRADAQLFADELRGAGKQVVVTPAD